jgi:hypothetical protein
VGSELPDSPEQAAAPTVMRASRRAARSERMPALWSLAGREPETGTVEAMEMKWSRGRMVGTPERNRPH